MSTASHLSARAVIESAPGLMGMKDRDSVIQGCSAEMAYLLGYTEAAEVAGIYEPDLRCPAADFAPIFRRQDQIVMGAAEERIFLDCFIYSGGQRRILVNRKGPLHNRGQIEGVVYQLTDLTEFYWSYFFAPRRYLKVPTNASFLVNPAMERELPTRERQVLLGLVRGKTVPEIAASLGVGRRTAETYVDRLKARLGCYSQHELIERYVSECMHPVEPNQPP